MKYQNIREEELKNKVGADWFKSFDTTEILGNIDFTVFPKQNNIFGRTPLLWAEAKTGDYDVTTMFVQLILTIGKARTFDKTLPPAFLGAFDFKKIAFVSYEKIQDIFFINDFNWNVTPSNHETKEFILVKNRVQELLAQNTYIFEYQKDAAELKNFIANNIAGATEGSKVRIDKNNFIPIYLRWLDIIKPIIDVNWDTLKKSNIQDSDFYLADLFVNDKDTIKTDDDLTIKDNLFVVYQNQGYKIAKEDIKQMFDATIQLKNKAAYEQFWRKYKRPPIKQFQDYIIERRDLLVPQDIRERKGAFFTPKIWVDLSQKYIADVFGENWQDEYYVWDCAAGTGNLLAGLTNKYNVYASTLDQADVNVMHERIDNGALLLKNHCFQFDFLNDEFLPISEGGKLPDELYKIITDAEKRKKLIVYINPPYAEATTAATVTGTGANKKGVATTNKSNQYFAGKIGNATNELFALFMAQVYDKIHGANLAQFSKMKFINGNNFAKFKTYFRAQFKAGFVVPASTFDNVKGVFPIGFTVWSTDSNSSIEEVHCDVYDAKGDSLGQKGFYGNLPRSINKWIKQTKVISSDAIGFVDNSAPDFQNNKYTNIARNKGTRHVSYYNLNKYSLIAGAVYFSVRCSIDSTWLNDRDQFLYPNDTWQADTEFQSDCLAFALFHGQNRIVAQDGINHWIPFTEGAVNAREKFASNFMTDFMAGKLGGTAAQDGSQVELVAGAEVQSLVPTAPLIFSPQAQAVFDAGRELWRYYFTFDSSNPNASLYDIREFFQGRNEKGKMNNKSTDEKYTELIANLRTQLKLLAAKIEPTVYEHGFLKK